MREYVFILTTDNKIVSLTNKSINDHTFQTSAEEVYKYVDRIKALIHTHENDCIPSNEDVLGMYVWRLPWIIVSKNCIRAYLFKGSSILELDVNSLISEELYDFLMKILK